MTASTTPPTTAPTQRSRWRRHRGTLALVVVLVLAGLVVAWLNQMTSGDPLDPRSATPDGSRALATLLSDHGVEVDRVSSLADVRTAVADDAATVLLARPARLAANQLDALAETDVEHLVVLAADEPVVSTLTTDVVVAGSSVAGVRAPGCGLPAAERAGDVHTDGTMYRLRDTEATPDSDSDRLDDADTGEPGSDTVSCYGDGHRAALLRWSGTTDRTPVDRTPVDRTQAERTRTVDLLGSSSLFTNERLDEQGHAALALNLLGQHERLVWYIPGPTDLPQQDEPTNITSLLPSGAVFGAVQLAVAVGLLMLAYARRLGPLVTERLPVIVRASETVEGRARLYRRFRARDRTADALRRAARSRLRRLLGLTAATHTQALVAAVTERTGYDERAVRALLVGDPPGDPPATDAELVRLADHLDALEQEVRQS